MKLRTAEEVQDQKLLQVGPKWPNAGTVVNRVRGQASSLTNIEEMEKCRRRTDTGGRPPAKRQAAAEAALEDMRHVTLDTWVDKHEAHGAGRCRASPTHRQEPGAEAETKFTKASSSIYTKNLRANGQMNSPNQQKTHCPTRHKPIMAKITRLATFSHRVIMQEKHTVNATVQAWKRRHKHTPNPKQAEAESQHKEEGSQLTSGRDMRGGRSLEGRWSAVRRNLYVATAMSPTGKLQQSNATDTPLILNLRSKGCRPGGIPPGLHARSQPSSPEQPGTAMPRRCPSWERGGHHEVGKRGTPAGTIKASLPVSCTTAGIPVSTGSIVIPGCTPRRCPSASPE
jgi:hypothetical protein